MGREAGLGVGVARGSKELYVLRVKVCISLGLG